MSRLKKLENVLAPSERTKLEVVFVNIGQTKEKVIKLKYGKGGVPDEVKLLVVRSVAPDKKRGAKRSGRKFLRSA